jgi:ATP-dependent Clp protease protease subunit
MNFWNFARNDAGERVLRLDGPISEDAFWGDEVTPADFRTELEGEEGDITVTINSPGGSVFAAAEIYTMLKDYKGKVTVKVESIAASAASVVAMAGDEVYMSPVSVLMVHNPMTCAMGNERDFEEVILTLKTIKKSIANAYAHKSGKTVKAMCKLMDGPLGNGSWLDANDALGLGLIDGILFDGKTEDPEGAPGEPAGGDETNGEDPKARAKALYADFINSLAREQDAIYSAQRRSAADRFAMAVAEDAEDAGVQEDPGLTAPAIGLDGKTPDGSMPYALLMRELNNLK